MTSAAFGSPATASASTSCGAIGCRAEVSFPTFAAKYSTQQQSEWCWAASISMLFNFYGHPVSQDRIVYEAYGGLANISTQGGYTLFRSLNRSWKDDMGVAFNSRVTGLFDAQAGLRNMDNRAIISSLQMDRPLIIGAHGHAMVLTLISYQQTLSGPNVVEMGVFDPWPGNGARDLQPIEALPPPRGSLTFIAAVDVD